MTERTAELYNDLIINVWGIPSYLAAADDYQDFVEYSVADGSPPFWLARGSAQDQVIGALEAASWSTRASRSCVRRRSSAPPARRAAYARSGCATAAGTRSGTTWEPVGPTRTEPVDELVLALPPGALSTLVRSGAEPIVRSSPRIAEVARLTAQNVPLVHLYFKRKLRVPAEPVGLAGSSLGLRVHRTSRRPGTAWPTSRAGTVLALSSSDPFGLPGTGYDGRRAGDPRRGRALSRVR